MTPQDIFLILSSIPIGAQVEHFIQARIVPYLPTCKQRAIAAVQCSMLENGYKELCSKVTLEHNFDLHKRLRGLIEEINKRKR